MDIGIIGAGVHGSAVALVFSMMKEINRITLCDNNSDVLTRVKQKINSEKITTYVLNADDTASMVQAFCGCEVIIDMLPPNLAPAVMKVAIIIKSHYINSAFEQPFWSELVNDRPLHFNAEFININKTAILGCGNSPGLVNVFVRKYCDAFDTIETIQIVGLSISGETNEDCPWVQNWSPEQSLRDYFTKPCILTNGRFSFLETFSNREIIDIGCFGKREVSLHSHEEVYSLPRNIRKGIRNCEFKYQFNDFLEKLSRLGFTPDNNIIIDGVEISPCTVLVGMIPVPVESYLREKSAPPTDDYVTKIFISGIKDKKRLSVCVTLPPLSEFMHDILKYRMSNIEVALPIAVATKLMLSGLRYGIVFPEEIEPSVFISTLSEFVKYHEDVQFTEEER